MELEMEQEPPASGFAATSPLDGSVLEQELRLSKSEERQMDEVHSKTNSQQEMPTNPLRFLDSCVNCCEAFSNPEGNAEFNECFNFVQPIVELAHGASSVKVSQLLSTVFKLDHLSGLENSEEHDGLPENMPLCGTCASILKELAMLYEQFRRVRKIESFLNKKLETLDEIVKQGLAAINNPRKPVKVKEEPKDSDEDVEDVVISVDPCPSKNVCGEPWVCLTRIRADQITACYDDPSSPDGGVTPDYNDYSYEENGTSMESDEDCKPKLKRKRKKPTESAATKPKKRVSKAEGTRRAREVAKRKVTVQKKNKNTKGATKRKATVESKDTEKVEENLSAGPKKRRKKNLSRIISKPIHKKKESVKKKQQRERAPRRYYEQFYRRKLIHPCPCVYCTEDFDTESDRVEHLKSTHCHENEKVICAPCGKMFRNEGFLKHHAPNCGKVPRGVHLPPYICEKCGKEYATWCGLRAHDKLIHPLEKPYECDECSYKTSKPHFLGYHKKRAHTDNVGVQCFKCHKILKSQESFHSHYERMHTEEGLKKYKEKLLLDSQQRKQKKSEMAEPIDFVCKDCNIDFQTKNRLTSHRLAVHDTHKRFICELCGKGFIESYRLRKHLQFSHTEERPFICDQCGKNYKSMDNLKTHLKTSHDAEGRQKYNEYSRMKNRQRAAIAKAQSMVSSSTAATNEEDTPNATMPGHQHSIFPLEMAFNLIP